MNLQEQHFLIDIDGTITKYRKTATQPEFTLFHNCFLPVIRDLMLRHGWEKTAAERALFESVHNVLRWDYGELLRKFRIPRGEADDAMRRRHEEMLDFRPDTVELIRRLHTAGAHLYIISNNPYWGCRWKLQRANLDTAAFEHIFSTDHTGGCKSLDYVWEFVLARIGAEPDSINTLGDDPREDGILPLSLGAGRAFILARPGTEANTDPRIHLLENALDVLNFFEK